MQPLSENQIKEIPSCKLWRSQITILKRVNINQLYIGGHKQLKRAVIRNIVIWEPCRYFNLITELLITFKELFKE